MRVDLVEGKATGAGDSDRVEIEAEAEEVEEATLFLRVAFFAVVCKQEQGERVSNMQEVLEQDGVYCIVF